ncbi:YitT family protein [Undibacterium sp. CY18W]|uniref:YitT family protein n=1 Tax=Undibacterium hunanense TaxID=2762292 RepID=A0ABR6ZX60_9BURK|nr:YitT family protein [Undibacterium hunanense]MBC3920463.1 YitT family protein [Undibacterium hunanense]
MKTVSNTPPPSLVAHSLLEDVLAIITGTVLVSLGVALFNQAGLLTGGTAGLAFLLHYSTGLSFGLVFFLINLPFYWLAWRRMGWRFTLKTFCAVALVSVFSGLHPKLVHLTSMTALTPFYVALIGGLMMGVGFIVLFRHQASLGGINILALYLQEKRGIRAGKLQMAVDFCIVMASLAVVTPMALLASVIGAFALNLAISLNHRPDRYVAM